MARKTNLIQLDGAPLQLSDQLATKFNFDVVKVTELETYQIKKFTIFENGKLNPGFRSAIFLIPADSPMKDQPALLSQLPAHNIIVDRQIQFDQSQLQSLALKDVQTLDFSDVKQLSDTLYSDYWGGQFGFTLDYHDLEIDPGFSGQVKQQGNAQIELTGEFGQEFEPLINWKMTYFQGAHAEMTAFVEQAITDGSVQLQLKIHLLGQHSFEEYSRYTFDQAQLDQPLPFELGDQPTTMSLQLLAKGQGSVTLGNTHLRQSRHGRGTMFVGGHELSDQQQLNDQVYWYFNPGDMKPPLNVYFSGYRTAEGFEGNFMMQGMNSPYLLICDPRLEGGAFYLGSEHFEQQIVQVVRQTLKQLGFTQQQLILSGLSMGTFGALYYSSWLSPKAVIVGKPLTNVGSIAGNEKIKRPGGFPTSLDVMLSNGITPGKQGINKMNQVFWHRFKQGNHANTTFIIAYMKNDDYDQQAFPELYQYLRDQYPDIKILHKGLIGRHNDNSAGINKWFLAQYYNILQNSFHRTYSQKPI